MDWLAPRYTPDNISVRVFTDSLAPGVYHGHVTITSPPGSDHKAIVPVTLTATPGRAYVATGFSPSISSIVNAASLLPGPISPGEIVILFGILGPDATSDLQIGPNGKLRTSIYGIRVLFNGQPAPLIYVSARQINAIAPYELAGRSTVQVEIDMSGIHSSAVSLPVAPSAPGLFSQTGSGQGAAAILNQDSSPNTPLNAAPRGSIIQIFGTGEGLTTPPGITGEISALITKKPVLTATVQIGGVEAKVISATAAPNSIAGLFQINVQIPTTVQPGPATIVVRIGPASSQAAATVSVR